MDGGGLEARGIAESRETADFDPETSSLGPFMPPNHYFKDVFRPVPSPNSWVYIQ